MYAIDTEKGYMVSVCFFFSFFFLKETIDSKRGYDLRRNIIRFKCIQKLEIFFYSSKKYLNMEKKSFYIQGKWYTSFCIPI